MKLHTMHIDKGNFPILLKQLVDSGPLFQMLSMHVEHVEFSRGIGTKSLMRCCPFRAPDICRKFSAYPILTVKRHSLIKSTAYYTTETFSHDSTCQCSSPAGYANYVKTNSKERD
jgi:hypothetical protein